MWWKLCEESRCFTGLLELNNEKYNQCILSC